MSPYRQAPAEIHDWDVPEALHHRLLLWRDGTAARRGLLALVPGALGFRGISAFLRSATGSLEILAAVLVIAAGLVVGLLVADATLPARHESLRG